MRYRVNPVFWLWLQRELVDTATLAEATGSTVAAIYRIRSGETFTVSRDWMAGALTLFRSDLQPLAALLFSPIGEDRWRCLPRLWGLLAERRIKLTTVGTWIGMSQQRISHLRRSPTHTISDSAMRTVCAHLAVEPEECFTLVTDPRLPRVSQRVSLAS